MIRREFIDKGHYFVLVKRTKKIEYCKESGAIVNLDEYTDSRTHIIIDRNAMPPHNIGLQIIRFEGDGNTLMDNPYAGVSLTKEEWAVIYSRMASL